MSACFSKLRRRIAGALLVICVLLVAAGKAGAVGADCAAPGQIVLDVGIHVGEDGKLRGDVDFAAFEPVARAITEGSAS